MAPPATSSKEKMRAPKSGVTIRMYRLGHGDCFLLCFRKSAADDTPFFMLIDCGKKSGSEVYPDIGTDEVIEDIAVATGGKIDLAVVTHEHEDHVSGFPIGKDEDGTHIFNKRLKVEELWLAWTEDEKDDQANELRDQFNDQLLVLAMAAAEMDGLGLDTPGHELVRDLLRLETGHEDGAEFVEEIALSLGIKKADLKPAKGQPRQAAAFAAAQTAKAKKPKGYKYKIRLAGLRHHVGEDKIRFLDPDAGKTWSLPGVNGVKVYPLGPPRNLSLLRSLDPRSHEEFHVAGFGAADPGFGLFRVFSGRNDLAGGASPFALRHGLPAKPVLDGKVPAKSQHADLYKDLITAYLGDTPEQVRDVEWRRINGDWLDTAEALALRINNDVNNTSLVLLFELPASGKTLLFTGDAQRGSWISWSNLRFGTRTARELLANCVFYKAGHHGSHNATLKGTATDDYANLDWLAQGECAEEFTTMIPSNKKWAWGKKRPWKHPLPAIENALEEKARGRVMITSDKRLTVPARWKDEEFAASNATHKARTKYKKHFIEHWIPDE